LRNQEAMALATTALLLVYSASARVHWQGALGNARV